MSTSMENLLIGAFNVCSHLWKSIENSTFTSKSHFFELNKHPVIWFYVNSPLVEFVINASMLTTYTLPAKSQIWFNLVMHLSLLLLYIWVTPITKCMPSTTHYTWKCWRDDIACSLKNCSETEFLLWKFINFRVKHLFCV